MKVILTANVQNLGKPTDIVNVKKGYARNWLFPEGLAVPHSVAMEAEITAMNAQRQKEREEILANATHYADQLAKIELNFTAKASEKGVLFGAISTEMIANELAEHHQISLDAGDITGNFKKVGTHSAKVKLGDQVAEVKVKVVAE